MVLLRLKVTQVIKALEEVIKDFNTKINEQFISFKHTAVAALLDWQKDKIRFKNSLKHFKKPKKA